MSSRLAAFVMFVASLVGAPAARADFVAGYGFNAPTGRYEARATDNARLGMWSHDSRADVPELLLRAANLRGRSRIFGIGPDVTMGVFQRDATAGVVNVRYLWDPAAKTSFEGGTVWMSFTLARLRQ